MKKLSAILIILVFSQLIWAQNIHQKKSISDNPINKIPYNPTPSLAFPYVNPALGDTIGITDYDYWANSVLGKRIVYYNGPHIVTTIRPFSGNPLRRALVYINLSEGTYHQITPFEEGSTSFPQIDIMLTGSEQGKIGISNRISRLAIIENDIISIKQTPGYTDQSFVFSKDNIFLFTKDEPSLNNGTLYQSTDGGDNFLEILSTSVLPIYSIIFGEADIFKSPNEQFIGIVGTAEGDGHVYNGIPASNADNVWLIYSTDAGNTWNGKSIGYDGLINSVQNKPNFAPLYENFGQVSGAVGDDGIFHIVANGYGLLFDDELGTNIIGSSFPVLYWNSQTENWQGISNPAIDDIQEIVNYYPGNNIGQSYPQIAIDNNGTISIIWTGPQLNENNQLSISGDYYLTDIYQAYSYNNGGKWYSDYSLIAGKSDISETFAIQANHLRQTSAGLIQDIIFMEDLSAGSFVLDEGDQTNNPIIYKTIIVPPAPLSVDDPAGLANNFTLYQNYPNPFNPATSLSFLLKEESSVKLNIFNLIGENIGALLNDQLPAGLHKINFNASDLPSGVYFYQIQSEKSLQTKKMTLLK